MRTVWKDVRAMFSTRDPELTTEERRWVYNAQCRDRYAQRADIRARSKAVTLRWYWNRGGQDVMRESQRRRLYGMAPGDFDRMLVEQGGRCAMPGCDAKPKHVDHDHATGRVRSLLCHRCNIGLGFFERNADQYARYLARFTKET